MTSKALVAVGLGGVVATAIGITTAQPSIADSFIRIVTSPAVVTHKSCTKVLESPAVIDMTVDSPAVIRSTTGVPMAVEQKVFHRPFVRKVMSQPAMIEVNRVVEGPTLVQRVVSQPVVIEKFVEKPAVVDCVVSQPIVITAPTVIKKSITSPVIILDDPSDRFLYDFSTHRKLKFDLND